MRIGSCSCGDAGSGSGLGQMQIPMVPAPMVLFAAFIGFMLGAMCGMKAAEKKRGDMMAMRGGPWGRMAGRGMGGPCEGKPWMGHMPPHHHHGKGSAPCFESHSEGRHGMNAGEAGSPEGPDEE